jgi:hypothetical protein
MIHEERLKSMYVLIRSSELSTKAITWALFERAQSRLKSEVHVVCGVYVDAGPLTAPPHSATI